MHRKHWLDDAGLMHLKTYVARSDLSSNNPIDIFDAPSGSRVYRLFFNDAPPPPGFYLVYRTLMPEVIRQHLLSDIGMLNHLMQHDPIFNEDERTTDTINARSKTTGALKQSPQTFSPMPQETTPSTLASKKTVAGQYEDIAGSWSMLL
ncbi:MAG: hypothetical protein RIK85_10295 [Marinobacter sp.]